MTTPPHLHRLGAGSGSATVTDTALAGPPVGGFAPEDVGAALDRRRARLRSDVSLAARVLPTHYPLPTFIAVNPLDGLRHLPFHAAAQRAGELYGARATLPESSYRRYHAQGRITDRDLAAVLTRRYPHILDQPPLPLGERAVELLSVLRADLLHGQPAPDPVRVYRSISEQAAPAVADRVDALSSRWCAAFLTSDTSAWPMPGRHDGFYPAWRDLAYRDHSLTRAARAALRALPARAEDATLSALHTLGVAEGVQRDYLTAHLTRQPGWAAHIRWRSEQPGPARIDLLDYLALRLTYETLLLVGHDRPRVPATTAAPNSAVRPAGLAARAATTCAALGIEGPSAPELAAVARALTALPATDREEVWLEAFEHHYRTDLLTTLLPGPGAPLARTPASATEPATPSTSVAAVESAAESTMESTMAAARPPAQLVCCIDTRSEGLRRHLETLGEYETFGFAGFFAMPIRYTDLAGGSPSDLCPVLIKPAFAVTETPATAADARLDTAAAARRHLDGLQTLTGADTGFHHAKDDPLSPFALAEAAGWVAGPLSAAKTLGPRHSATVARRLRRRVTPPLPTDISIGTVLTLADRALYARVALATMGLSRNFARLVVFCAHGSTTTNNPYQAALDCGACGGQRGGPTARTAAAILNDPAVRAELDAQGISIPPDTWFLAAEHDTATDHVTTLDDHLTPTGHHHDLDQLRRDLTLAGQRLSAERCADLPATPTRALRAPGRAARHAGTRSADWAQTYPEWGLAGNAAFIIGPREHTRRLDLHRRVFLHSYRHQDDPDGTALETILTAPLVVAYWINAQYYFSTVAPGVFGAGTKTIHNVLGGVGVLSGHAGDLRLGLPWQSVATSDTLIHEPMRLLTVIHAPTDRTDTIIDRNPILQELLHGQWLTFTAPDDATDAWHLRTPTGWQPWPTPAQPPATNLHPLETRNHA